MFSHDHNSSPSGRDFHLVLLRPQLKRPSLPHWREPVKICMWSCWMEAGHSWGLEATLIWGLWGSVEGTPVPGRVARHKCLSESGFPAWHCQQCRAVEPGRECPLCPAQGQLGPTQGWCPRTEEGLQELQGGPGACAVSRVPGVRQISQGTGTAPEPLQLLQALGICGTQFPNCPIY